MPSSLKDLQTPLTSDQVSTVIYDQLSSASFPVQAWQPNGAARSFVETQAVVGSEVSKSISAIALMATIDTSVGDFLDHVLVSNYDEFRQQASAAIFNVNLINQGAVTYGPLTAKQITILASNGQTFKNTGAVTITAGVTTVAEFVADFSGSNGNIPAQTMQLVTPFAGVVVTFGGAYTFAAADTESDVRYRDRAKSKWGTLRIQQAAIGFVNLAESVAPAVVQVGFDATNPRGPGTADVYLAAVNATAGSGDVTTVQAAFDLAVIGNGVVDKLVKAFAASTITLSLTATVYYANRNDTDIRNDLTLAWTTFLNAIPLGGYDLSPGPTHIVQAAQIITALQAVNGVVSVQGVADFSVPINTKVIQGTTTFVRIPVHV